MTDRTHPDSGRITTSSDVIAGLHEEIARLERELQHALASAVQPPADYVMVPVELAERVQETVGEFLMGHDWRQRDMDTSDEFGALLVAAPKAEPPKPPMSLSEFIRLPEEVKRAYYEKAMEKAAAEQRKVIEAAEAKKAAQAETAAVAGLSAPVSPMAKMALALREKAAAERNDFDRRVQSGEWGPMPEPGTEADALPNHVAEVKGDDAIRILRWSNRVGAFDYPVGTKLYATQPQQPAPSQDAEDAARYRWLRDGNNVKQSPAVKIATSMYGLEWDAAIDAARAQQEGK